MNQAPRRAAGSIELLESRLLFAATEIVRNGGFEGTVSSADWVLSGNLQADSRFTNVHTGAGYAYLATTAGTAGNSLSGTMYQQLTIPANATSASLSFWHKITTAETTTTSANDTMTVQVMNAAGTTVLQSISSLSNLNASSDYVQKTIALNSSLIGQTVRVFVTASTDASLATTFRVDDVSLSAEVPGSPTPTPTPTPSNMRVVGYLPYYRQSSFSKIDLSQLTHINYFSIQATDAGVLSTPNINDANLATVVNAMHALGKKVSITVGPTSLSNLAASSTARAAFANNLLVYCNARNLDGVDIDWEPPAGNNVPNYGLLIDSLYTVLQPAGKLITAAVNPWTNEIPVAQVNAKMDWLNVMCYDFAPANHSTYSDSVSGMVDWTNYGVQKSKIVMGMPFYGKSGTTWSNDVSKTYGAILADYKAINGVYPGPDIESYVDSTGATYYFNNVTTVQKKAAYVRDNGYGGAMIWELGQDWWNSSSKYDSMSLLPALNSILRPPSWLTGDAGSRFTYYNHTLDVKAGNVNFVGDAFASDPTLAVNIASGSSAKFNVSQKISSLNITGGAATVPAGGNKVLNTKSISITGNGKLDLTDNDLIVDYTAAPSTVPAAVEALIKQGYNGGNWQGNGITSSTAAAAAAGKYTLGVANNSSLPTPFSIFSNQSVDSTAVLVKFTYNSDRNLDGVVNVNDSFRFNGGYIEGAAANWLAGDLNLDGILNINDSFAFNASYNETLPAL